MSSDPEHSQILSQNCGRRLVIVIKHIFFLYNLKKNIHKNICELYVYTSTV